MFRKIIVSFGFVLLLNTVSFAQPYLICDPNNSGIEWYEIEGLPFTIDNSQILAQVDGSIKLNLINTPIGSFPLNVRVCNVWECTEYVPFVLLRPEKLIQSNKYRLLK